MASQVLFALTSQAASETFRLPAEGTPVFTDIQ
jgi:hypothetical protein